MVKHNETIHAECVWPFCEVGVKMLNDLRHSGITNALWVLWKYWIFKRFRFCLECGFDH